MRIIFIGDTHGRDTWKKIVEQEVFDLVIFAGDYVSTHERVSQEEQISNLEEILRYKEENSDKIILLRGNHDMQHLGYSWAECSGLFPKVQEHMSKRKFKERFLKDTQWLFIYDNIVFSHAGISKTWLETTKTTLGDINNLKPSEIFGFTPGKDNIFDSFGNSIYQPLTWIRPQALIKDAIDDYIQVIGHTPVTKISDLVKYNIAHHIWLCDNLPCEYLVIEDGEFIPTFVGNPVISLGNRYRYKVWLENTEGNKWILKGDDGALNYLTVNFVGDHILSVDPSGGPYLSEGDSIAHWNKKITKIEETPEGFILTLEDESKEI